MAIVVSVSVAGCRKKRVRTDEYSLQTLDVTRKRSGLISIPRKCDVSQEHWNSRDVGDDGDTGDAGDAEVVEDAENDENTGDAGDAVTGR